MKFDNDFKEIKIRHIIIMFILIFLISMLIVIIFNKTGELSDADANKVSLFMGTLLVAMMIFKLRPSIKNNKRLYRDFKSKLNMKEIIWIILFITCLEIGSSNILIDISYIISPSFTNWFINDSALVINSMTDYWIIFIMAVILAPFTEEIIFRNVLFKRISKKFNIYIGLIVSSIIFSSFNFGNQMIGIFLLGIINCILYVKYENILMTMFIYCIDSIVGIIRLILFDQFRNKVIVLNSTDIILYALSGVILFSIGMIFFIKFINENKVYLREMHNRRKSLEIN